MSGLISSKEAKLAWANGQEVQVKNKVFNEWKLIDDYTPLRIFKQEHLDFRLKPQTITVTLELPKPFKPEIDDKYWYILTSYTAGYTWSVCGGAPFDQKATQFGAYRTEEEVKQVVEALRAAALKGLQSEK